MSKEVPSHSNAGALRQGFFITAQGICKLGCLAIEECCKNCHSISPLQIVTDELSTCGTEKKIKHKVVEMVKHLPCRPEDQEFRYPALRQMLEEHGCLPVAGVRRHRQAVLGRQEGLAESRSSTESLSLGK